jgi:hypothetical protein
VKGAGFRVVTPTLAELGRFGSLKLLMAGTKTRTLEARKGAAPTLSHFRSLEEFVTKSSNNFISSKRIPAVRFRKHTVSLPEIRNSVMLNFLCGLSRLLPGKT